MKRSLILILAATAITWMAGAGTAAADGTMLARAPYVIHEHQQHAYLDWDEDAGFEQLTIRPGFRGDARDFVWLVPVPSEPGVDVADAAFFGSLRAATEPIWRDRDEGWSCDRNTSIMSPDEGMSVDLISSQVIDVYEVLVVWAEDADALADSLLQWGHLHDGNVEEVTPILEDYVAEGWSFVAARIDSAAFVAAYPHAAEGYWYTGALRPLVFGFETDQPVYPMRLSRVSADRKTWIELYVEADHRYEHPRLDAVYANRFSEGELDALRRQSPLVADRLEAGRLLTRLQGVISPAHMTEDFFVQRARDDREFRPIHYSGWPVTGLLFGGAGMAWVLRRWRRKRRK
ncbi:MAG: DUF2330 domain-containing protein [bacterium]|nr:DUF2330 domain-containing protein [bacterium]